METLLYRNRFLSPSAIIDYGCSSTVTVVSEQQRARVMTLPALINFDDRVQQLRHELDLKHEKLMTMLKSLLPNDKQMYESDLQINTINSNNRSILLKTIGNAPAPSKKCDYAENDHPPATTLAPPINASTEYHPNNTGLSNDVVDSTEELEILVAGEKEIGDVVPSQIQHYGASVSSTSALSNFLSTNSFSVFSMSSPPLSPSSSSIHQTDQDEQKLAQIPNYHNQTKHLFAKFARGPHGLDWANQPNPFRSSSTILWPFQLGNLPGFRHGRLGSKAAAVICIQLRLLIIDGEFEILIRKILNYKSTRKKLRYAAFGITSTRYTDHNTEKQKLLSVVKDLRENNRELELVLEMDKRETADSREVLKAEDLEHKAWAHVQFLRTSLDEHSLELRVKTTHEVEAISQQRLAAAEDEIADLWQKLEDSKMDLSKLSNALKSKNEENEEYFSEIETIGQVYDVMQTQNRQLLRQITGRDDYNIKLVLEGMMARQVQGVLGCRYMWWKGFSLSDLMYVTKRNMAGAVSNFDGFPESMSFADAQNSNLTSSALGTVTSNVSPVLKSPTLSVSPKINSGKKSLRTSSMMTVSQNLQDDIKFVLTVARKEFVPEEVHTSFSKSIKSGSSNRLLTQKFSSVAPTEKLGGSICHGLEVIDGYRQSLAVRHSSFRFSFKPAELKVNVHDDKTDVGVQTLSHDEAAEEDLVSFVCNSCKSKMMQIEIWEADDSSNLQLVPIAGSDSAEKSRMQLPKVVEKVMAGAIRREMALEEFFSRQASEIVQLNRLEQQYKHERECNSVLGQTREDIILLLDSLMDGVLPNADFLDDELSSLTHEHKVLKYAMQMAMKGHAHLLEHYVMWMSKKAVYKAGVRGAESRWFQP